MYRDHTKVIQIGNKKIGGGNPILIQSMTNTKTEDVQATVEQILALEAAGCDIIRCAVPTMEAAKALKEIKKQIHIPLVADIHFDYRLAIAAMENGADKIRINPGNIGSTERIKAVVDVAKERNIPIRVGVNSGSLEKELVEKYHGVTAEGLVESALDKVHIIEELGYDNLVISIKSSDVMMCARAHELIAEQTSYPLHVGITEDAKAKIKRLGGYDKLYRIKLEGDYLAKLAFDGAKRIYGEPLTEEVKERMNFELYIMKTMGFPGYFLIVQDFINAARKELGVSVGPGRGSAAGSAVAYCLGITKIDPIQYDLLFERFLNPDRISLPDIDVDFDDDGRGEVLRWVTNKYGQEKVAHIITYGTMATKMAIKDVARVQKLPLSESDRLCKLVPDKIPDKKLNLPNAIAYVPELQAAEASSDPLLRDTIKYAKMLEGNVRGTGVHACGTIICRDDITDWVPVSTADDKETGEKMLVTQYEGSVIEDTGLIKMDFLGLKTLSIIKEAVENIRLSRNVEVDVDAIEPSLLQVIKPSLYGDILRISSVCMF